MAITKYPAALYGATLTASASANTVGAYVELVASLPADIKGIYVSTTGTSIANLRFLINLATGAAASEVVVVANLPVGSNTVVGANMLGVYIPIALAAGARLSANCQCQSGTSRTIGLVIQTVSASGSAVPVTYGAVTASTQGTVVDPGATPDTKGAYVQLTAATSADLDYLIVLVTLGVNSAMSDGSFSLDLATGAALSETIILPDLTFVTTTSEQCTPCVWAFPIDVPSGTRLSARAASTITDATDRLFEVVVVGVANSGFNGGATPGGAGGAGTLAGPVILGGGGVATF